MAVLIDKCILLVCCFSLIPMDRVSLSSVSALLLAVTLSALNSYWENRVFRIAGIAAYCLFGMFFPPFCLFLPLVCYDLFAPRFHWTMLMELLPLAAAIQALPLPRLFTLLLFSGISLLLRLRTSALLDTRERYRVLRDDTKEFSLQLERKNRDLMEKQDYEIKLATLGERNRIAREIHDNVGHLLSSSILQVGALMAINRAPAVEQGLTTVKQTLSTAMDSIRSSVHNLHEESVDLFGQLTALKQQFQFCPIVLDYQVEGPMNSNLKYCFLSIVKEALSNVIKHSDATLVTIAVREHPALFQLIVQDNGAPGGLHRSGRQGIGLRNMEDRVTAFHGNLHLDDQEGFRIFVSIPKEDLL
ncbi:MAG: sensor histidine kinase [Clostridiales bacterium]|jgi:signal transduction histidine kinase|nr:sensor histidine kinase [Clostridiales bacterium]